MRCPIQPDEALLIAVARFATGAGIHRLLWLASRYRWACEKGFQHLADEIEKRIRTELRKTLESHNLAV